MGDLVKELRETLRYLDPRMTVTGNLMEEAADRIEALEKELDEAKQEFAYAFGHAELAAAERDTLRADLAAMERQRDIALFELKGLVVTVANTKVEDMWLLKQEALRRLASREKGGQ